MREYITKEEYLVGVVNSISKKYSKLRSKSKGPSFALQYGGTYHTLVTKGGFPIDEAKSIVHLYLDAYKVSIDWTADKIREATSTGFVTLAYGGILNTPILGQTILGNRATPYEAQSEARSAGNALTQSYCFLNIETLVKFMHKVWESEYRYSILPIGSIHDSNYFLIPNNLGATKWYNDKYIDCVLDYTLPELQHPIVKLGGVAEIYYPSWNYPISIDNYADIQLIHSSIKESLLSRKTR